MKSERGRRRDGQSERENTRRKSREKEIVVPLTTAFGAPLVDLKVEAVAVAVMLLS